MRDWLIRVGSGDPDISSRRGADLRASIIKEHATANAESVAIKR